jgi:hypothetical protein
VEKILDGQEIQPFDYSGKKFIGTLFKFFESPFKDDKKFVLAYLANITRDKIGQC